MKSMFSGFYTPTEKEFEALWNECLFVFDTNTLLNLYRYSKESRDLLLKVMEKIKDRMWIPHQVALEYHKHMFDVIYEQENEYVRTIEKISSTVSSLEKELKELRHSNINVESIISHLNNAKIKIQNDLEEQKLTHPNLNSIKEQINELFGERVGREYTQEQLDKIFTEGEQRYSEKIPPGFMDLKEKQTKITINNKIKYKDEYGDLVYWLQILEKSKEETVKSVILITDDNKDDWILKVKGQKKGPHPELIYEFRRESGNKLFYLYNTEQFLTYAEKYLRLDDGIEISSEAIDKAIQNVMSTKEFLKMSEEYRQQFKKNIIKSFKEVRKEEYYMNEYKVILKIKTKHPAYRNEIIPTHFFMDLFRLTGIEIHNFEVNNHEEDEIIVIFESSELIGDGIVEALNNIENKAYYYFVDLMTVFTDEEVYRIY